MIDDTCSNLMKKKKKGTNPISAVVGTLGEGVWLVFSVKMIGGYRKGRGPVSEKRGPGLTLFVYKVFKITHELSAFIKFWYT